MLTEQAVVASAAGDGIVAVFAADLIIADIPLELILALVAFQEVIAGTGFSLSSPTPPSRCHAHRRRKGRPAPDRRSDCRARAAVERIFAVPAEQDVVAFIAMQMVARTAAVDGVVAGASIDAIELVPPSIRARRRQG